MGAIVASPPNARAACNLIPSAIQSFRGTLGTANKPFAAPGDFVEVHVDPARCDGTSGGLGVDADDQNVTIVFTPPLNGPRRVAFLTADPGLCGGATAQAKRTACEAVVGTGNVQCFDGPTAGLAIVSRDGVPHLSFRFPDTDARFAPDGDDRTLAGPATIAVSPAADPLPCGLATSSCVTQAGLIACLDDLYGADGTCQPNLNTTFPHFTALPPPNDYRADCFADAPCLASATEVRGAIDTAGNLLVPVNWSGILVRQSGIPVPRLLRATINSLVPFATPPTVSFGSFTPEGARLPPIFEPQADPTIELPNTIALFGTADAAYTILRAARRHGACVGGTTPGAPCTQNPDCGGTATCAVTCAGGDNPNTPCTKNGDCTGGGRCGALYGDMSQLAKPGGPILLLRDANAFCQQDPGQECSDDQTCVGVLNTCVSYAFEARTPIPLEGLAGSDDVFAFSVSEPIADKMLNGDADKTDLVLTLQDRTSGRPLPIGAGGTPGLAITAIRQPPFQFPALATEDRVVAFLQPEALEATAPAQAVSNGDGDAFDTFLRVFRENAEGTAADELTVAPAFPGPLAVDAALAVNGRSLAVSDGKVFFRTPEVGAVPETTVRISVSHTGAESNGLSSQDTMVGNAISATGRFVVFQSLGTNLIPGGTLGARHLYVRDRDFDGNGILDEVDNGVGPAEQTTELISKTQAGVHGDFGSSQGSISADGRWVAFATSSTNLPSAIAPCPHGAGGPLGRCTQIVVKDRDTGALVTVSEDGSGNVADGDCEIPAITPDGRFVVFRSSAVNLDPPDANPFCNQNPEPGLESCNDIFVHDRDADEDGTFDEIGEIATERVSLDENDQPATAGCHSADISDDGRFVVFETDASLVAHDMGGTDVYVRDRLLGTTTVVSDNPFGAGTSGGFFFPIISGNGRLATFESTSLFGTSAPGGITAWARDLVTGAFENLNITSEGAYATPGTSGGGSTPSPDARFVAFDSQSPNLAPPTATVNCRGGPYPDCFNWYVRDRLTGLTKRASVTATGGETNEEIFLGVSLTPDGRQVAFTTMADNLLGPGNDTNLCDTDLIPPDDPCHDVFVRTPDFSLSASADRSGDDDFDDTILEVLDAGPVMPVRTTLCPAGETAAAAGRAAFLRPEASGNTGAELPDCPTGDAVAGGVDLNDDTDAGDQVVHLWPGSGAVENLGLAATAVALSADHVAAIDAAGTLQTRSVGGGGWTATGQAAQSIQFCGSVVALMVPVASHFEVGIHDPVTHATVLTGQAAEEIVCSPTLVAFRTRESVAGVSLNLAVGDVDTADDVLQTWDISRAECLDDSPAPPASCLGNSRQAILPCRIDACDPRIPYRVNARSVKFLTFECDQQGGGNQVGCPAPGGTDITGNGEADDTAIQVYNVATNTVTPYGTIPEDPPDDPFQGGDVDDGTGGSGTVQSGTGRCIETIGGSCASCDSGAFCDGGTCKREQGVCVTSANCPPDPLNPPNHLPCVTTGDAGTVPASRDSDGDGVPDHLDNCTHVANGDQDDDDADGAGNLCDLATCGNGIVEYEEQCDGPPATGCTNGCAADCRCAPCVGPNCTDCANVLDSRTRVLLRTRNGAGQLVVTAFLPLASYVDAPVTVRLDDDNSSPMVQQAVGALAPVGQSNKKWQFKTKADGVQSVQIVKTSQPGQHKLTVRSKRWFTNLQADDAKEDTHVTITVGTQCFTHEVTTKVE
jgi:Tol biopolymer transport system component